MSVTEMLPPPSFPVTVSSCLFCLSDTVSVFECISRSLPSLSSSPLCSHLSAHSIYRAVSLRHMCHPCQQNGWQTVFISMLKDAGPVRQLWELSTGIRQSPPCREAAACLPGWRPFWARPPDSENGVIQYMLHSCRFGQVSSHLSRPPVCFPYHSYLCFSFIYF